MRSSSFLVPFALSLSALGAVGACGGSAATGTTTGIHALTTSGSGGSGGGTGGMTASSASSSQASSGVGGSETYPAPHPDAPQVITLGGPVLATPRVVPIFFSDDDATLTAGITDFLAKVGATSYWSAICQEYGVGPLTSTAAVQLQEASPGTIDDSAIQAWLEGKLNSDDAAFPAPDGNTIYAIHYPFGNTITATFGGSTVLESCKNFGGYHSEITLDAAHGSQQAFYIVMPFCDGIFGLNGLDAITGPESHELVEAVTDPQPFTMQAYDQEDEPDLSWLYGLGGGEVGDMCAQTPGVFVQFPGLAYTVQRTWSNAAAAAGQDPCVPPAPGEVYFNSVPVMKDMITTTVLGPPIPLLGVQVPAGGQTTIDVDLFSDGPLDPWQVAVQRLNSSTNTPLFSYDLDNSSGSNGDVLHLTITDNGQGQGQEAFYLVSQSSAGIDTLWVGFAGN